ncbi:MAG: hypothetical protein LC808_44800, partial [Actinobacteria bacterium]|nr:hypothetical protein [Actinomycetota bacterium]
HHPHRRAQEHVERQGNQNADDPHPGDDQDQQQLSSERSLRPGTAVPAIVFVASPGRRDGPSAHLSPADVVLLRRALAAAFRDSDPTPSGGQGEAL